MRQALYRHTSKTLARRTRQALKRYCRAVTVAAAGALLLGTLSCGGHHPTEPTSGGSGGSNQQPPPNNPPVIDSIAVQGTRASEPANFADIAETVDVAATVHDDETPIDQLQYQWSASLGSIDGAGAHVRWTAPAGLPGSDPVDVTITLKLIEKYGASGGTQFEHDVTGTATLSLHDSVKEVGDMARQFLLDFSDSTITDVSYIMRNFATVAKPCKDEEANEVAQNRIDWKITESSVGPANVGVKFGSFCPFRTRGGDACAQVPVRWKSIRLTPGGPVAVGNTFTVFGTDQVTAFYVRDQKRWGLCESDFDGQSELTASFIR